MNTQEIDEIKAVKDKVIEIQKFNTEDLIRQTEFGSGLSFENAVEPAERLVELFRKINPSIIDDLPKTNRDQILNSANKVIGIFSQILNSDIDTHTIQIVKQRTNELFDAYQQVFTTLYPYASYSMFMNADLGELEIKANRLLQETSQKIDAAVDKLSKLNTETIQVLEAAKKAAQEQGVAQQATFFQQEADKYDEKTKQWFKASFWSGIVLALVIIGLYYFGFKHFNGNVNVYDLVQFNVSRVVFIALFVYALFFCSKNYFSSKHNAIINHHRTNALRSYEALALAAKDTANTDIILNHAAACVFTPQNTGYSGSKADGNLPGAGSPPNLILKASAGGKD